MEHSSNDGNDNGNYDKMTMMMTTLVVMVMNHWTNESLQMRGGVGFVLIWAPAHNWSAPFFFQPAVIITKEEKYSNNTVWLFEHGCCKDMAIRILWRPYFVLGKNQTFGKGEQTQCWNGLRKKMAKLELLASVVVLGCCSSVKAEQLWKETPPSTSLNTG